MASNLLVLFDEAMIAHDPGVGHPEQPERLRALQKMLRETRIEGLFVAQPSRADREAVRRVHEATYVDRIDSLRGTSARLDADTVLSPASVDAAYLAAGAAVDAVDALISRTAQRGFALVRPPGHHAEADRAMGFCVFNNIAIAAAHAIEKHGCERVLIVDWDIHHGNGTQHLFEHRRDVLTISAHRWMFWPGTGRADECGIGPGRGFAVNAPLPAGWDDAAQTALFEQLIVPIASAYRPDLVLVAAGFDNHRDDLLGDMAMTEAGFARICRMMCEVADQYAQGRIGLMLEGGYHLQALANSVRACLEVMSGHEPPQVGQADAKSLAVIDELRQVQRSFWPV